jgi:HAD superfamily hydrolase (TIGR01458 family)
MGNMANANAMTAAPFSNIQGLLCDLEGVIYVGNQPIPGAIDAIRWVKAQNLPCRFVTNTTTQSRAMLHQRLQAMGLPIELSDIISAPYAAVLYLRQLGHPRGYWWLNQAVQPEFAEFSTSETAPEVIVIGDIGNRWSYDLLNSVFRMVMAGAELVALHKGKFWQAEDGLNLDIGLFVAGLEYVTGKSATIIGKPAADFFRLAYADLGVPPEQVAMIGDDIENDVQGAQQAGLIGILAKTGKYRQVWVEQTGIQPDAVLTSIAELPQRLG